MIDETEIDLEIVDAGTTYTLYAAALVNLAIKMNKKEDPIKSQEQIVKYANQLEGALIRCRIDKRIPITFKNSGEVVELLQTQKLINEITNLLVKEYSRRQENIFLFTVLLGGILTGELVGADGATSAARTIIHPIARNLDLPDRVLQQCLEKKNFRPFHNFLQQTAKRSSKSRKWYQKSEFWIGTLIALGSLIVAIWQLLK